MASKGGLSAYRAIALGEPLNKGGPQGLDGNHRGVCFKLISDVAGPLFNVMQFGRSSHPIFRHMRTPIGSARVWISEVLRGHQLLEASNGFALVHEPRRMASLEKLHQLQPGR